MSNAICVILGAPNTRLGRRPKPPSTGPETQYASDFPPMTGNCNFFAAST